jgi:acetoin utilization protein AcuA
MEKHLQKRILLSTPRGDVIVSSFCTPDHIAKLSFGREASKFASYKPIVSKKGNLINAASGPDTNVTLACSIKGEIIGFGILEYPSAPERWSRVGDRTMLEVSVIEVDREWRSMGISRKVLHLLLDHPLKEDRIIYMVGYSWTWDTDGKGIEAMAYRDVLVALFSEEGFSIYQTNEPNILMRPENLFMARIGANISKELQRRFKMVRFDIDLYA